MSYTNDTLPSAVSYTDDTKPSDSGGYLLWDTGYYLLWDTASKIIVSASANTFTNDSKP